MSEHDYRPDHEIDAAIDEIRDSSREFDGRPAREVVSAAYGAYRAEREDRHAKEREDLFEGLHPANATLERTFVFPLKSGRLLRPAVDNLIGVMAAVGVFAAIGLAAQFLLPGEIWSNIRGQLLPQSAWFLMLAAGGGFVAWLAGRKWRSYWLDAAIGGAVLGIFSVSSVSKFQLADASHGLRTTVEVVTTASLEDAVNRPNESPAVFNPVHANTSQTITVSMRRDLVEPVAVKFNSRLELGTARPAAAPLVVADLQPDGLNLRFDDQKDPYTRMRPAIFLGESGDTARFQPVAWEKPQGASKFAFVSSGKEIVLTMNARGWKTKDLERDQCVVLGYQPGANLIAFAAPIGAEMMHKAGHTLPDAAKCGAAYTQRVGRILSAR